jgi:superfamily II RNA helicase
MKICDTEYDQEDEPIFSKWDFELSPFQKWAIHGLLNNKNVLITAHTGSGKTLPAEAAIDHFTGKSKRVIYTSPIKALTNQKLNEFTKKFPDISFGIITGDNKFNPEAQVLLMTAEILRNTLFRIKMAEQGSEIQESLLSFEMDIKNDLACVIIDEAHYINDTDRGHVWEETIMMLPVHVQLLLLSATLNKPEEQLVPLIENREGGGPEVYICPTETRVVPLSHYAYLTIPQSNLSNMSGEDKTKYKGMFNKLQLLKGPETNETFNQIKYEHIRKTITFLEKQNMRINKYFVLNELVAMLKMKKLLPAIVFVFSRKQVDILATKVQQALHDEDSKMSSTVEKECEGLLKGKLPNWKEYTSLPEYKTLINLLKKGIAVHHAGILKEFREMVELLFDKGYIKLLFATETFAVGINMPTKTTVFTSLEKFDGNGFRHLKPSEYTQMAGRAGRRGIDVKGTVIHMNNLFSRNNIHTKDYKYILTGPPNSISSKFTINLELILRLISSGNIDIPAFISRSILADDVNISEKSIKKEINALDIKLQRGTSLYSTPIEILQTLNELSKQISNVKPKKRRDLRNKYDTLMDSNKQVASEYILYCEYLELYKKKDGLILDLKNTEKWISDTCEKKVEILIENGFLSDSNTLTSKGQKSIFMQETPSLPVSELLDNKWLENVDSSEIAGILSCFTNMRLPEEHSVISVDSINTSNSVKECINELTNTFDKYKDIFNRHRINNTYDDIHLNLCELVVKWCSCDTELKCMELIDECRFYEIGLGDFVKAILKINNIVKEIEGVATISCDLELLGKLRAIPELTLKFCVTNQSLYL